MEATQLGSQASVAVFTASEVYNPTNPLAVSLGNLSLLPIDFQTVSGSIRDLPVGHVIYSKLLRKPSLSLSLCRASH